MNNVSFYQVNFRDVVEEVLPLMQLHFDEVSPFRHKEIFDPDVDMYLQLDGANRLPFSVAKYKDKIIGYNVYSLMRHPHCKVSFAHQEVFYVLKEYRGKGVGRMLLEFSDMELRMIGIKYVCNSFSAEFDETGIIENNGCKLMDKLFIKEL